MGNSSESIPNAQRKNSPILLRVLLAVLGVFMLSAVLWLPMRNQPDAGPAESPSSLSAFSSESPASIAISQDKIYPTDKRFIIQDRLDYESGSMMLEVPRLDLYVPVLGDVSEETLKHGVGLYDYAQPPGPGNRNVSIAGHRDIYGSEFLKVDTITDGDMLYLTYKNIKYTYEYVDTIIVAASDLSPIYCKEYSCITLTSCDPVGTSLNRIIITGRLVSAEEV